MSGNLYHGRDFRRIDYIGNDGSPHYEVVPVDGGYNGVSNSNWKALTVFCEAHGIPRSAWPEFEDGFDVPLDEVREKNAGIREALINLPQKAEIGDHYWLVKLIGYLQRGEIFFYTEV